MNIALVLIFAEFGLGYSEKEAGVIFLVGKHTDFDSAWYFDVGVKICVAMITNSFTCFIGKLIEPFVSIGMRLWDRNLKKHLNKLKNYVALKN